MRYIALWLIGLCVIVFVFQQLFSTEYVIMDRSVALQQPWRVVTAIFAHSSLGHLLSNIIALGIFGLVLEGRIGPQRVWWLFLIAGVVINVVTPYQRSLGASGAIYAIMGCLALLRPRMIVWAGGIPMPMILAACLWLFLDIVGAFAPTNVGNLAHIGGLFIGAGYGWFLREVYADKPREKKKRDPETEQKIEQWEEEYMR